MQEVFYELIGDFASRVFGPASPRPRRGLQVLSVILVAAGLAVLAWGISQQSAGKAAPSPEQLLPALAACGVPAVVFATAGRYGLSVPRAAVGLVIVAAFAAAVLAAAFGVGLVIIHFVG